MSGWLTSGHRHGQTAPLESFCAYARTSLIEHPPQFYMLHFKGNPYTIVGTSTYYHAMGRRGH